MTGDDWRALAATLEVGGTPDIWAEAFDKYFYKRLDDRYFTPIRRLQNDGDWAGEGFAIVSVQCAVIEFLAATREGKNYKLNNPSVYEYSYSGELYRQFLITAPCFNAVFSEELAAEFYRAIRCALLHEARTKEGWRIWASGSTAINHASKIIYRNQFQKLIGDYVDDYGRALTSDQALQTAFLRKFNHLAE